MSNPIHIDYTFKFKDGQSRQFCTALDGDTLAIVPKNVEPLPEWTMLSFQQCPGCPLNSATHPRCPVAVNLVEIAEFFKEYCSYEEVEVTVSTDKRSFVKQTSAEEGLASLLEIYLAGSDCPTMDKMRPGLDNYLPFSTPAEATYRFLAIYLTEQYLLRKNGKPDDMDVERLPAFLKEMQETVAAFLQRVKAIEKKDALRNSMVLISNLISIAGRAIEAKKLQRIETIFLPDLK